MIFEIDRDLLKAAIEKIVIANEHSAKKATVDSFMFTKIQGYGDHIRLFAHNALMSVEIKIDNVGRHTPFAYGVCGRYLKELVPALPEGTVQFDFTEGCRIKAKGCAFRLNVIEEGLFPVSDPSLNGLQYSKVDFEKFFEAVGRVIYCTNDDSSHAYSKGVTITPEYFYGTDGVRIARYPNRILPLAYPTILPLEALRRLIKMYSGIGGEGSVCVRSVNAVFINGGICSVSALLAATPPDFGRAIPQDTDCMVVSVDRAELQQTLRRTMIVANDSLPVAEFEFSPSGLEIKADYQGNRSVEAIACSGAPTPFSVRLNARFVHQALANSVSDTVQMELRAPTRAVIIKSEDGGHLNVIMPIRS